MRSKFAYVYGVAVLLSDIYVVPIISADGLVRACVRRGAMARACVRACVCLFSIYFIYLAVLAL